MRNVNPQGGSGRQTVGAVLAHGRALCGRTGKNLGKGNGVKKSVCRTQEIIREGVGKDEKPQPPALYPILIETSRALIKGTTPGTWLSSQWKCFLFTPSRRNQDLVVTLLAPYCKQKFSISVKPILDLNSITF